MDRFEVERPPLSADLPFLRGGIFFFFFPLAGCFHPTEPRGHAYEFARA